MPLTAEDVRNKQFSTGRFREGYDMDEVDAFLDEVEAELTRLSRENDDLRARLAASVRQPHGAPEGEAAPAMPSAVVAPAVVAPPAPTVAPSEAAARMLELAQRTADEHVAQAKAEADRLVTDARVNAQRVTADLEHEQAALKTRIEELKAFEREYRTRLRTYLEGQLRDLEQMAAVPGSPPGSLAGSPPASGGAAPAVRAPVMTASMGTPPSPPAPAPLAGPPAAPPRPAGSPFAPPGQPGVQPPSGPPEQS